MTEDVKGIVNESILHEIAELADEADPDFFITHVHRFIEHNTEALAKLRLAVDSLDRQTIHNVAHSMGGAAANFGGVSLSRSCVELENSAAHAGDENLHTMFGRLEAESAFFTDYLQRSLEGQADGRQTSREGSDEQNTHSRGRG